MRRRHGWQLPLHPLQLIGISVYGFLLIAFYTFLGPFLGNRLAENTLLSLFTFTALAVMVLFVRCTAIDPSDTTCLKKKKLPSNTGFHYGYIARQMVVKFSIKIEKRILKHFIKRRYPGPWQNGFPMEPLLPFPLIIQDDAILPDLQQDTTMYCSLCDFQVKINSKHCRSCDRCVDGFDHHCRWLNNCIGMKNYTTFILLMVFVLLLLLIESTTAITIFVRCFADQSGITRDLEDKLHQNFPRGVIAAISVLLAMMAGYGMIALGQLFFFHVILIKKGMQTYDYILAMKEESHSMELWEESSLSSDEDTDGIDSPNMPPPSCMGSKASESWRRLSIRIDGNSDGKESSAKKQSRVSVNPWTLMKMSKQKALFFAAKARERMFETRGEEWTGTLMQPLPTETKHGPSTNSVVNGNGGHISSPRRRISGSLAPVNPSPKQNYRNNFDLKLAQVSQELESHISRQALCSVLSNQSGNVSPS